MWIFRKKTNQVSNDEGFKIYLAWDLQNSKAFPIDEYTTSNEICQKVVNFLPVSGRQDFNKLRENFDQYFCLVLAVRNPKTSIFISKRKLNPFEFPLRLCKLKPKNNSNLEYLFVFQELTPEQKSPYNNDFLEYREGLMPSNEIQSNPSGISPINIIFS